MMRTLASRHARERGFTVIEFLIVGAIAAILLAVAVGGFGGMASRKRMEGIAGDIATHIQQARTEAVARNMRVRVTFGTNCLVVNTQPLNAITTCNGNGAPASTATIIASAAHDVNNVTVTPLPAGAQVSFFEFEPRNGLMTTDGGNGHGILIADGAGAQLRVNVGLTGRVEVCTPTGVGGYSAC